MFVFAFGIFLWFSEYKCVKESGETERKGTLVKEQGIIISLSSRRGFVLHRLPSAPFHPPPILSFLGNLCYSELSIVGLAMKCVTKCKCVCLCRTGPVLTSSVQLPTVFISEVVQTVTQLFLVLPALHCAVFSSPQCGCGDDTWLVSSHCRDLLTGCM